MRTCMTKGTTTMGPDTCGTPLSITVFLDGAAEPQTPAGWNYKEASARLRTEDR